MRCVAAAVVVLWLIIAGRLVQVQWWHRQALAAAANRQHSVVQIIPARPGEILDRRGKLLATTITVQSLFVDPSRIPNRRQTAQQLSAALNLDEAFLAQRLEQNRDKRFLWIKRRLSAAEAAAVRRLDLPPAAWGFRPEYLRRYPQGALAAHVLGLRDIDGIGRGGVEESFHAVLCGEPGRRVLVRDARGRAVSVRDELTLPPRHGKSIVLALDAVVQLYAERALDALMEQHRPQSACAIVMDPHNGDVLAMASRPGLDPNNPAAAPPAAWKNTAVAAVYEPGSTFKPFVTAMAVDRGIVDVDEVFDCERGEYRMGGRRLHDVHPHGRLTVGDILVKSSNIGMAKIGERLGNRSLYEAAVTFGFGRSTGTGLPGELPGIVRPLREWNAYSTGSIPMGQELAATPVQVLTAYAALANGGRLLNPRLVLRETDLLPDRGDAFGEQDVTPRVVSGTVKPAVARWLIEGPLTDVVRRGTARSARLADYTVFGKTGTAQKPDPQTARYSSRKHVSSFVCGAPAEAPRVVVLVVLDEPTAGEQFGGTVAAPAAAEILRKTLVYLRVPSSRPRTAGRE